MPVTWGEIGHDALLVAMHLGEGKNHVFESGMRNFGLDHIPVMVHFGSEIFGHFHLVRIEEAEYGIE